LVAQYHDYDAKFRGSLLYHKDFYSLTYKYSWWHNIMIMMRSFVVLSFIADEYEDI